MTTRQGSPRGPISTELVVVLLVLVLLVTVALPLVTRAVSRGHLAIAEAELIAGTRDAVAAARFEGRKAFSPQDLTSGFAGTGMSQDGLTHATKGARMNAAKDLGAHGCALVSADLTTGVVHAWSLLPDEMTTACEASLG